MIDLSNKQSINPWTSTKQTDQLQPNRVYLCLLAEWERAWKLISSLIRIHAASRLEWTAAPFLPRTKGII